MLDRLGRSRDAIAALEESLREHPYHAEVAAELAERKKAYAKGEELVRAIRATLAREPDHPRARRDLALTLHKLQRVEEAESLYEQLLGEDATDDATRLNLVGLLMTQDRPRDALARVDVGRERAGHDPRLDCAAGRILAWHLDRRAQAVAPMRACRDGGARLTPLDLAVLADAGS
jgi:Flp pilus assembly protein TadD